MTVNAELSVANLPQRQLLCYTPSAMDARSANAAVVIEPLDVRIPAERAVVAYAVAPMPAILESSQFDPDQGRYSIFACDPVDHFSQVTHSRGCPFSLLAARMDQYPAVAPDDAAFPFRGGWIGHVSYEAGLAIERIDCSTRRDVHLPDIHFRLYDTAAVLDHRDNRWYAVAVEWPVPFADRRPPVGDRLASVRHRLQMAAAIESPDLIDPSCVAMPLSNMTREAYFAKVDRAKRYIEAGDIYQVNLTQRFAVHTEVDALALYRRLRQHTPSAFAAMLPFGGGTILCASLELFLQLHHGHVITRPIKGTRPRTGDERVDALHRRVLASSPKERAELTMIIDLLRNDIGRVCTWGSVEVTEPGRIEAHPTVFHRVATIEGELAADRTWVDLLRASFPGGSITGAPKIRAMQIINELEPTSRGVYCGSIGIIGLDGSVSLNIAIRTMVHTGKTAFVYAGGAIVADSTPEGEYDEVLAKASGMFGALGCQSPAAVGKMTMEAMTE